MKHIVALFICLICSIAPIKADSDSTYLAIFCNKGWEKLYKKHNPDLIYTAHKFSEFDDFLELVKLEAKGRPIQIDLAIHGDEKGTTYLLGDPEDEISSMANSGYLVNAIENHLGNSPKNTVFIEACNGGYIFRETLDKNYIQKYNKWGDRVEKWNHKFIEFPIYGVINCTNYVPFIYNQYKYNVRYNFHDYRKYLTEKKQELDTDKDNDYRLSYVSEILYKYGL